MCVSEFRLPIGYWLSMELGRPRWDDTIYDLAMHVSVQTFLGSARDHAQPFDQLSA